MNTDTQLREQFGEKKNNLYLACLEIQTTEETLRKKQKELIEKILENTPIDARDKEFKTNIHPFIELISTNAFTDLKIAADFLSDQHYKLIQSICKEVDKHAKENFFEEISKNQENLRLYFSKFKNVTNSDMDNLITRPIERLQKYKALLNNINTHTKKLSLKVTRSVTENTIKDTTLKILSKTITNIDEHIKQIGVTIKKNKFANTGKLKNLLDNNKDHENLIDILIKNDIFINHDFPCDEKRITKSCKKILYAIKHKKPKHILRMLRKYGFGKTSTEQAKALKQGHYRNKIEIKGFNDWLKDNEIEIHAQYNKKIKFHAWVGGYRSPTLYLINRLNKAYEKKDFEKIKGILPKLGVPDKMLNKAIEKSKDTGFTITSKT